MENKMPRKRILSLGIMAVLTLLLGVVLALLNGMMLDGLLSYLLIGIVFFALYVYLLESNRERGEVCYNRSNNYLELMWCYGIGCFITAIFWFLPSFTCPALIFSLFISIFSSMEIAIGTGIFFCVYLCGATGMSYYELSAYCILVIFGAQIAKSMQNKRMRMYGSLILFSVSVSIPMLFYYLAHGTVNKVVLGMNLGFSLVLILLYFTFADKMYEYATYEGENSMEKIIREDFPLVSDIKRYSMAEYVHAMKVSMVARKCAKEIHADEVLAASSGFYYRLGILEGEPFIENGVRLAYQNSFPENVISILREYSGGGMLPSTKESAIVHMVDACLKKSEMLNSYNLSSSWNQDMMIYQTLNELSATGVYDESGLSMNQFLKVRELLVREELGYDDNH